jgi:hypothetical protein
LKSYIGQRLLWKGQYIEDVDDGELNFARDHTHKLAHSMLDRPPMSKAAFEWADEIIARVCAIEAECVRRGQPYRDMFAFRHF